MTERNNAERCSCVERVRNLVVHAAPRFCVNGFVDAQIMPEDVSKQLGVMMGSSADGSALASSLQRLATNGVVGMQELQSAATALIGSFDAPGQIAQWVTRFADSSVGSKLSATRLAEMVARLDDMGKAEFTELANAGVPIFQALAGAGCCVGSAAAGWVRPGRWRCSGVTVTGHSMPCKSAMARKNRVRMAARNSSGFLPSPRAARESMLYSADVNVVDFVMLMSLVIMYGIFFIFFVTSKA